MLKDLISNIKATISIGAELLTADEQGDTIDRQGYNGNVLLVANVGASLDTLSGSVYAELEVQESDDDSTYTAVADADLSDSVTGTNVGTFAKIDDPAEDDQVYKTEYRGSKRYVQAVVNLTGTHTNGIPIGITGFIGGAQVAPV